MMTRHEIDVTGLAGDGESSDRSEIHGYVAGLREASGTFTGTYDTDAVADLLAGIPDLVPVEIDTHDKPNLAADAPPGSVVTVTIGGRRWVFPVDHAEPLDGNRVRIWAVRAGIREVTDD